MKAHRCPGGAQSTLNLSTRQRELLATFNDLWQGKSPWYTKNNNALPTKKKSHHGTLKIITHYADLLIRSPIIHVV
jgi:hypothetical protein